MAIIPEGAKASDWFLKMPLALRRRWWTETDYGRLPPSEELKQAIKEYQESSP